MINKIYITNLAVAGRFWRNIEIKINNNIKLVFFNKKFFFKIIAFTKVFLNNIIVEIVSLLNNYNT